MMQATTNSLLFLRFINIILITIAATIWIIYGIRYKCLGVIAPLSWLVHVLIYGMYRFLIIETAANQIFMQNWTALIITHTVILLLLLGIISGPPASYSWTNGKKEEK